MKQLLVRRWFLIVLVLVLSVGVWQGPQLQSLARTPLLRHSLVAAVLFLMALPLKAEAMWRTLRRPAAPLLASGINLGLLPLFAWPIAAALQGLNPDLAGGVLVAAATPCTLASASVWTRRAGGDDSVAIMVTILTNATCFVITPFWLFSMIGDRPNISMGDMIQKLGLLVVLPMAAAQIVRLYGPIGRWATARRIPLGVLAQCGILSMIFLGSIQTGVRLADPSQERLAAGHLAAMTAAVLLIHTAMFAAGMGLAALLRLPRPERIAVGFAGSQKTLMVGLQVALEVHLSILPMVVYHVGQLFIDTLIADRLRRGNDSLSN